ncbi:hypothetical protein D3H55_04385 [Bacillus salacetis]|uniref:Uncharacterized protein n=1 Tax=Bacillus salacetis TaxID=2315464 RepID=A0A3A1R7H6_9BACI|nr:hypothetical protein D3H55_04385 [Bacillus salacetis]
MPDFSLVFEKERTALFFPAHQGIWENSPGFYLKFILKAIKSFRKEPITKRQLIKSCLFVKQGLQTACTYIIIIKKSQKRVVKI